MGKFDESYDEDDESKDDKQQTEEQPLEIPTPIALEMRSFLMNLMEDADTLPRSHRIDIGPLSFDFSIEDARPGTHEKMIQELYKQFDRFIIARLLREIPEDQLEQFADIVDQLDASDDPNENEQYGKAFGTFLEQHIPYFQEIRAEIFFEFRHLYLDGVAKSRSEQNTEQ